MALVLDLNDVTRATDMTSMIEAVEKGLREEAAGRVVMPPRLNMATDSGFFRVMPAIMNESGVMGYKEFHGSITNGVRYMIAIYDAAEGSLLSMMDASYLTAARTGATTGVATKYMARQDAKTAAVIGSGLEARTNLQAVAVVRKLDKVTVFSPNPAKRQAFADWIKSELGIEAVTAETAEQCTAEADIIVVATNTSGKADPIAYRGAWMREGMHVNSIGSTMPRLREIDPDTFDRAQRIATDSVAQIHEESGDVITAVEDGKFDAGRVVELKDLVTGAATGRTAAAEITLFKSVGTAVQDVMAGMAIYEEARRQSLGTEIPDFLDLKTF
ncbi:MAG: hypothetical protein GEU28_04925 [Dehalococcoidia bacterium]|nr:hypothetical protein [Dehalococcoidia bacterium]